MEPPAVLITDPVQRTPEDALAKSLLISELEELIYNLKYQLNMAQGLYDRLQEDLGISSAHQQTPTKLVPNEPLVSIDTLSMDIPIYRCPNEILYLIFEQFLEQDHAPIRTLLLVNKHWNRLVMTNPKFWARIHISLPSRFAQGPWQRQTVAYLSACKERSQGLLLDVELDLSNFLSRPIYIEEEIRECMTKIIDVGDLDEAIDQLARFDWDFRSQPYESFCRTVFKFILGADGSGMEQWQSLHLTLPDAESAAINIWSRLHGKTPNLKKLVIDRLPYQWVDLDELVNGGLGELPAIERLRCSSESSIPLQIFMIPQDKLQHLEITFDKSMLFLSHISTWGHLQVLELEGVVNVDLPHQVIAPLGISISLPRLKELRLMGQYGPLVGTVEFNLPTLETFVINSSSHFITPPKVSPRHIRWEVEEGYPGRWERHYTLAALIHLVKLSSTTQSITVPAFAGAFALCILADLKVGNPMALPSLGQIIVERRDGRPKVIEVGGVLELVSSAERMFVGRAFDAKATTREILDELADAAIR